MEEKRGIRTTEIEVSHLFKSFQGAEVLKDFNLQLYKSENLVVIGRSGVGKSVLIKCIVGLIRPDSGNITVLGKNMIEIKHKELDEVRIKIGFLFQGNALYDSMTVRENLEFSLKRQMKNLQKADLDKMVKKALEDVGLPDTADMMPSELSGGMQRRIALARALILNPKIMFYDEPTAGLDPITGREISELIVKVQKQYNTSSIIITHDLACARITANRVVLLIDGIAYKEGTYEEMKESEDSKIKQFFKESVE